MLDISLIREKTTLARDALLKRMEAIDFDELLAWDRQKRKLLSEVEALKARKNRTSKRIPALNAAGENVDGVVSEMKALSRDIAAKDREVADLQAAITGFLEGLPNIPDEDVPAGGKENNIVVREWGDKLAFDFEPRDHVALVNGLGMVDYERGVKMGGSGYWLYKGDGARLEWALLNYFIEEHIKDGYVFVMPPHILTHECGYVAGQFPKFADDVFLLQTGGDEKPSFLLPTSETAMINFHRDEILQESDLPAKYFAYTPCYRREAGSYRTAERGMIRGHQFNKVELFQFVRPEDSDRALDELIEKAEKLVQGLGLHHRVSKLAARDCSAAMAKTFDIEVWIPSMQEYKEVSSASNARDYQARRGRIRFKRKGARRSEFVHTLNASGLATSRVLPAIVEQFQRSDGSVAVPPPLQKWVGRETLGD